MSFKRCTYILMLYVLEELKLAVCALAQDGGAERLHDFLDRHRCVGKLILRRAVSRRDGKHSVLSLYML